MGRKVKEKILKKLETGPRTVKELARLIGARKAVVKGQLTRLVKEGKIVEIEKEKYKLA